MLYFVESCYNLCLHFMINDGISFHPLARVWGGFMYGLKYYLLLPPIVFQPGYASMGRTMFILSEDLHLPSNPYATSKNHKLSCAPSGSPTTTYE